MPEVIKRVVDRIYEFDFSQSELLDGREIITEDNISEFVTAFKKRDFDKGILVTPQGYTRGLFYSSAGGGEIYNSPKFYPDVVTFVLNVFGLKKGAFYKITVISRDTSPSLFVTNDRNLRVSNEDKEILIDEDITGVEKNTEYHTIFRTPDNETNLFFRLGKIFISNIIIDEVELIEDTVSDEIIADSELFQGKIGIVAYGVFTTEAINDNSYQGRYLPMTRYIGKGINLYFDKNTNLYIIERDNKDDTIGESFTNSNYIVDINFNKVVNKGQFSQYNICEVSPEISLNTLKQGSIKFEFVDAHDNVVKYSGNTGRISIVINKLF